MATNFMARLHATPISYRTTPPEQLFQAATYGGPLSTPCACQPAHGAYSGIPQLNENPSTRLFHPSEGQHPHMFTGAARLTLPTYAPQYPLTTPQGHLPHVQPQYIPTQTFAPQPPAVPEPIDPQRTGEWVPPQTVIPQTPPVPEAIDPRAAGWVQQQNVEFREQLGREPTGQYIAEKPILPPPQIQNGRHVGSSGECPYSSSSSHRRKTHPHLCRHHSKRRNLLDEETDDEEEEEGDALNLRLANYERSLLDEVLIATAREIGLSQTEHAALKMDLFRNYIRTYDGLKDSVEHQQLHQVVHPILAEFVAKSLIDMEETIAAEEQHDAPESIPNVKGFRHGALFVHYSILTGEGNAEIVATYALDIAKKCRLNSVAKRLIPVLHLPSSRMQFFFNDKALPAYPIPLEDLGITDGATLEVFDNKNAKAVQPGYRSPYSGPKLEMPSEARRPTSDDDDVFESYIPRHHKHRSRRRRRQKRDSSATREDVSDGFDVVPSMAAMERLAKAFDSECRRDGSRHPCACNCAVCAGRS